MAFKIDPTKVLSAGQGRRLFGAEAESEARKRERDLKRMERLPTMNYEVAWTTHLGGPWRRRFPNFNSAQVFADQVDGRVSSLGESDAES